MKKTFFYVFAVACAGLMFTACSESDDAPNETTDKYSDKSYGLAAIQACSDLASGLESANEEIGSANLSEEQTAYLKGVVANVVDNVIIPTYTKLADNVEALEAELHGLNVNTITQADIDNACNSFKQARLYWEQSEAFLGGAASDFDVDPTIDTWPLNRSLLISYFQNGMTDEIQDDATVLGFHALEFILFRNGQPRSVSEFKSNDTYTGFTSVSGADELKYAQEVCTLLKERTYQLQIAWAGEASSAERAEVVRNAGLDYEVPVIGGTYADNLKNAGVANRSTFSTLKNGIAQLLSDNEGSCLAICDEVGTAKIANPFASGWIFYIESPYSYNSISDFQDNIRSIRNVWFGTTDGSKPSNVNSFYNFFASISGSTVHTDIESKFNSAISAIGNMPAPFVKYCSTVWNIAFEDDLRYELAAEEEE